MLKILIVEDELLIAEDIRLQLIDLGYEVTGLAISYLEAIECIMDDLPDLVLVDIHISGNKDGIELGKFLLHEAEIPFIYLTSHADKNTVERAKETEPDAYLLKPFKTEGLYSSIEIALSNASKKSGQILTAEQGEELYLKDSLFVKVENSFVKLKFDDIKYIKSVGKYLTLYLDHETNHTICSTFKSLNQYLPESLFFQTHESFIVNIKYIDKFTSTNVMVNGETIPLAKNRQELLISLMHTI
jgi:DNA-binding LytR/AlgR family response regulator